MIYTLASWLATKRGNPEKMLFCRFTKAQFEICRIDIVMNLCIYIFIYLYSYASMYLCVYIVQKQKTCCFLFQICVHLIDRLRNIFKKHNDMIFFAFPNAHKQNDMLFFLLFVISGDTENQPKSCPRRYPR